MKKLVLLLLVLLPAFSFCQRLDTLSLVSKEYNQPRKLLIYLPEEYQYQPQRKFEVAYVFDSQARQYFDCVHSTLAFLHHGMCPMIVIGIISENRNKDLLPGNYYEQTFNNYGGNLGEADKLISFISNDLVTYINKNYRTLPTKIAIGHSNGGTFISYCLLKKPELFNAYIAVSPNYAYDKEQLVTQFSTFDPEQLPDKKFYYQCNSNEDSSWVAARNKMISIFNTDKFKTKIHFQNQNFAETESHGTIFPVGLFNGIKDYINYQFFNPENLIAYYSKLQKDSSITLTANFINEAAYNYYYNGYKKEDAIKILLWGNRLFPENLNLYDSLGEMYQNNNQKDEAMKYYKLFQSVMEERKDKLSPEDYQKLKLGIEDRINYLKGHM